MVPAASEMNAAAGDEMPDRDGERLVGEVRGRVGEPPTRTKGIVQILAKHSAKGVDRGSKWRAQRLRLSDLGQK